MDKYENLKIHIRIHIVCFKIKYKNSSYRWILSFDQSSILEQAWFTYSFLGKTFEKKKKNHWRSRNNVSSRFKKFKIRGK